MTGPLQDLQDLGQSVWLDHIQRSFVVDGELERYHRSYAVTGVTSNPAIFEEAIGGSDEYDDALAAALARGVDDPEELFWEVATEDVRGAADVLRDVHESTGGVDGYVSLELPPRLSRDTAGSVALGEDLFRRLDRPNVMIKVPGTAAGVPVVEELTFRGVNVNVTLLFSLSQWRATAEAYVRGLERRRGAGRDLDVSSVASFFISRIDSKANDGLPNGLQNQLGIAAGHIAYDVYLDLLGSERWRDLDRHGARPQRVLFASTSTKDPELPEAYYVEALAVPGSVNTMPEATLLAVADEGRISAVIDEDRADATRVVRRAADAGVDLEALGVELQREGDEKFADSFDALLACIRDKSGQLHADAGAGTPLAQEGTR